MAKKEARHAAAIKKLEEEREQIQADFNRKENQLRDDIKRLEN